MKVKTLVLAALGFFGVLLAPALASAACIPNGAWVNGIFYDGAKLCAADLNGNNAFLLSQGGSGTVNTGTANQLTYYAGTGKVVSGTSSLPSGFDLSAGLITATGTTTANSLASRFAQTISVLDEGATCVGSSHDDTNAFTAAFTLAGVGGTVTAPGRSCYSATGVHVPPGETLVGLGFSPGNPNAGTLIQCPATLNNTCLQVGTATVNEAANVRNLTVGFVGTVTSGETADSAVVIAGFNSSAQNVMALNAYDGFTWANGVGSIGSSSSNLYTGQILHDHLVDNGFAELYIDQCILGVNGTGDIASNAFVGITGIDPNSISITQCQYNLGSSLSPKYWLDLTGLVTQTDGIYSFTSSTLDMSLGSAGFNLGLIHTDSTANLLRLRIHDFTFNAPTTPFFSVASATILSSFDLEHSLVYSGAFTMPSTSVAYDVHISHDQFFLNAGAATVTIATGGSLAGQAFVDSNTFQSPVVYSGSWGTLQTVNNDYNDGVTNSATGNISGLFTTGDGVIANSVGGLSDASAIGTMAIPAPVGSNAAINLVSPNTSQSAAVNFFKGATAESGEGYNIFANGYTWELADYVNSTTAISLQSNGAVNIGETSKPTIVIGTLEFPSILSAACLGTTSGGLVQVGTCSGGGGTPGGSSTDVQYNSSGSFGGNGGFVYDGTSKVTLGVSGTSVGAVVLNNATSGAITLAPPTGALGAQTATFPANTGTVAELNLVQSWAAAQKYPNSGVQILGSSTGATALASANSSASNFTATLPAATDTVVELTQTQTLTNKSIAATELTGTVAAANGGAGTITGALKANGSGIVSQAAASDLSNGVTGTGAVVLASGPTLTLGSATGLPVSTGVSGLGSGVATALAATPTGSGGVVLATSPTIAQTANISATTGNNAALNVSAPNSSQTADTNYLNGATVESAIGYNIFGDGHPLDLADAVNSKEAIFVTSGGVLNLGETSNNVVVTNVPTIGTTANTLCLAAGNIIEQQATSCTVSGRRYKKDIRPLTHGLDWVEHLTPSTYEEKADGKKMIGLIADDAGAIDQRLAAYNPDGQIQTIQPEAIIAVLTKAVQQEEAEIKSLQIKVSALRGANDKESHHRLRRAR